MTTRVPVRIDFGGAWTDVPLYADAHGGAVFNATIDRYVTGELASGEEGVDVRYGLELPTGSGLGTSAALNVAWLALITRGTDRARLAEQAYQIEGVLDVLGGRQDQWAAAHGGFNLFHFDRSGVRTEKIALPEAALKALESRSVLLYTNSPRFSGSIHEQVWGAYRAGRTATVEALHRLKELALAMPERLLGGDIDGFARLLTENWECQKALYNSVTNPQIDALFDVATGAGALGGKACGAGGGGCLYFVAGEDRRGELVAALRESGAREIPFRFEFEGVVLRL